MIQEAGVGSDGGGAGQGPTCLALELFELNALHLHQDDQALELGALDVIAGSGVEIRGYGERGSDESRQIRSEV